MNHDRDTTGGERARGGLRTLGVFAVYAALALVATRPLIARLGRAVPYDRSDPLLNTWLLWWNAHALPFSAHWWNGPFFHPVPGVLSFSESLVGLAPLTTPLQWLGASPLAAYGLAFILSFALSGLCAHLLGRALGLGTGPSFVAGLAFAFAPYRAGHLAHLQILSAYFIPLVFLGAHRFAQGGKARWLVLFAFAWWLQGLTNGYFLVFVSVMLAGWLLWFAPSIRPRRRVAQLLAAWAAAGLCLAPVLVQYAHWQATYGLRRRVEEIESLSADVLGLLAAAPGLAHWPATTGVAPESWLFPGLTLPLVLLVFLVARRRRVGLQGGVVAVLLAALAAAAALVAAVTALTGPWRIAVPGLVLSVTALAKPLAVACYALVLSATASRTVREAWRRGSLPGFYLAAAIAMTVLAWGPNPRLGGRRVWDKAPYFHLLQLPGVSALRSPARTAMPAAFALAIAGAIALGRLCERRRGREALAIPLVAAGVLWDGWLDRIPMLEPPRTFVLPEGTTAGAVLELPVEDARDPAAMYRGMTHGLPAVNGYSGHCPPHYHALRTGIERGETGILGAARQVGPLLVVVEASAPNAAALERLVLSEPGAQALGALAGLHAYALPGAAAEPSPLLGARVPLSLVHRGRSREVYALAEPGPVGSVVLSFGMGVSSLPPRVTIETGEDAGRWVEAWSGPVCARAFRSALRDPVRVPVVLETPGAAGRLLRVGVEGPWPIERIEAYRPAAQAR